MITDSAASSAKSATTGASSSLASKSATAASDFHSFLTLLTAQLRNQDPLSPLDSTQFVEQLASFSSVEQQIETNQLLETLNAKISGSGLDAAAGWIGMEVETESSSARYQGEPLSYKIPGDLGPGEITVTDRTGKVVHRQAVSSSGDTMFTWNGVDAAGVGAPHGEYTVAINYTDSSGQARTAAPIAVAEIVEARLINSEVRLVLSNGAIVKSDEITAVREKQDEESAAADVLS